MASVVVFCLPPPLRFGEGSAAPFAILDGRSGDEYGELSARNANKTVPRPRTTMSSTDFQRFRTALVTLRSRLTGDVSHLKEETLRERAGTQGMSLSAPADVADQGSDLYEYEFNLSLLHNQEQTLAEIRDALERMDNGTYGKCEECQGGHRPRAIDGPAVYPLLRGVCPKAAITSEERTHAGTILSRRDVEPGPSRLAPGSRLQVRRVCLAARRGEQHLRPLPDRAGHALLQRGARRAGSLATSPAGARLVPARGF